MTSPETLSPFVAMAMLSLTLLWYALIFIQKSRIVAKYEQDPSLADSHTVKTVMRFLFGHFGPGVRTVYYSMHLAFILATPDVLLRLFPGCRDLGPRRVILSKFSAWDLMLAATSTLLGISFLIFIVVNDIQG